MAKFVVVASSKDGKTIEQFSSSASQALHQVHQLREDECQIVTIYRDGVFLAEDDLVIEAGAEAQNKHKKQR